MHLGLVNEKPFGDQFESMEKQFQKSNIRRCNEEKFELNLQIILFIVPPRHHY